MTTTQDIQEYLGNVEKLMKKLKVKKHTRQMILENATQSAFMGKNNIFEEYLDIYDNNKVASFDNFIFEEEKLYHNACMFEGMAVDNDYQLNYHFLSNILTYTTK